MAARVTPHGTKLGAHPSCALYVPLALRASCGPNEPGNVHPRWRTVRAAAPVAAGAVQTAAADQDDRAISPPAARGQRRRCGARSFLVADDAAAAVGERQLQGVGGR